MAFTVIIIMDLQYKQLIWLDFKKGNNQEHLWLFRDKSWILINRIVKCSTLYQYIKLFSIIFCRLILIICNLLGETLYFLR